MKGIYKKYSSLSRALDYARSTQDPQKIQEAQKRDRDFAESLDKWTLVKVGLAFWKSSKPIKPINAKYEGLKQKLEEDKVFDQYSWTYEDIEPTESNI
ncbi:hypothetical protein F543_2380 [Bibersteinia trehalosi USDA-ARS-USMARC-189]|uniref:Uncharacterized protein n=2 Tax=Bibersteinia trehalosi TaxID=47735 RepID=W0R883_BIBTR|nr:hypothetical protein [Bibersteinia trehalosi]AHG83102.1 hypothetical protein F543_2380 [Bibersteinia trehalosi USDA-ARS-USMARC-189]AHG87309.1 hypothetical protein F544_20810 [Bibersteinia trehalosi USDA-ARS-USMARC-190]